MVLVPFSSDTFFGSYVRFKSDGNVQNSEATSENASIYSAKCPQFICTVLNSLEIPSLYILIVHSWIPI